MVRDGDGAESAPAVHPLTVAAAPAAAPPAAVPPATAPAAVQHILGLRTTPRCIRAADLRAAVSRTVTVRLNVAIAGPVRLKLERWKGKPGASKCPPPQGGAPAGRGGKRLKPGTYLPTVTAGGATARVKLWVLRS